jgi:hypothetical protein
MKPNRLSRLVASLLIGAAAITASGQSGVTNLGRAASCRAESLLQDLRSVGGYEILFGTVLTKMDPGVRRSALLALAGPSRCPLAAAASRAARQTHAPRAPRPAALAPATRRPACPAGGSLV